MIRKGFGLIQALIIIVLISGILIIAMRYAKISIKQTSDLYVKEAAELFVNSAVEMTLLAISGYDRATQANCLEQARFTSADGRFIADINITEYYLHRGSVDEGYCDRSVAIETEDSHGMAMLEVHVYTNPAAAKNQDKNISIVRRTLQRP